MKTYRLLGFYSDNYQVYDSYWEGDTAEAAIKNCRDTQNECDSGDLSLVAVLDEDGTNVYECDSVSSIADWP